MDAATWQKLEQLFAEATVLPADKRAAFCDKACAGDSGLRDELATLLQAHEAAETVLDAPPGVLAVDAAPPDLLAPGTRIGVWSIGALIRRGGAGEESCVRSAARFVDSRDSVGVRRSGGRHVK